jgi:hypothetical protein
LQIYPSRLNETPSGPIVSSRAIRHTPVLQFKKLEGEDNIYSVRIGLDYRALAVMKKDRIVWYWIGSHAEYDRLV